MMGSGRPLHELLRLYGLYVGLIAKANLFYRLNSLTIAAAVFIREIVSIVIVYMLFSRFDSLQTWSREHLLFLYSFLFLSYSLVVFFFSGIRDFEEDVRDGNCDRYLLRPLGVFFQVVAAKSDYAASIGHGLIGVVLFIYCAGAVGVPWTPMTILSAVVFLASGVVIQASIFLFSASLSFWTIRSTSIRNILFFNARRYAGYPVSIYPAVIKAMVIYVVPFAFVSYFPAQFFLARPDGYDFPAALLYMPPAVALTMAAMSAAAWSIGLRHYSSVGN